MEEEGQAADPAAEVTDPPAGEQAGPPLVARVRVELTPDERVWLERRRQERELLEEDESDG